MIKIFESVKDYVDGKYFDFITNREMNQKDPNYFGETSDRIAEDLYDFFYELIAEEINLNESWTSNNNLKSHFKKHCVGKDGKKSTRSRIRYDFTTEDELKDYEDEVLYEILNTEHKFYSLKSTPEVLSALSNVSTQPMSVLFDTPCGFKNSNGKVKIGLNSFANSVTTNFPSADTVNLSIITDSNKTISMYAVDARLIENKVRNIINNYIDDKNIKKLYKK